MHAQRGWTSSGRAAAPASINSAGGIFPHSESPLVVTTVVAHMRRPYCRHTGGVPDCHLARACRPL